MADTLIKGGVENVEILTSTGPDVWTAVGVPLLEEGMEGPIEEVEELPLSDGTSGSAGVRLTAAVACAYDAESPAAPFDTLDAAVNGISKLDGIRWTDGAGNVITVLTPYVRLDAMPVKNFGGVTARVYHISKTGANAGDTHAIT